MSSLGHSIWQTHTHTVSEPRADHPKSKTRLRACSRFPGNRLPISPARSKETHEHTKSSCIFNVTNWFNRLNDIVFSCAVRPGTTTSATPLFGTNPKSCTQVGVNIIGFLLGFLLDLLGEEGPERDQKWVDLNEQTNIVPAEMSLERVETVLVWFFQSIELISHLVTRCPLEVGRVVCVFVCRIRLDCSRFERPD